MAQPVRYDPSVETVKAGEADTIHGLEEQFHIIQETTAKDYKHGVRAVHAKAHGLVTGTLTVREGLPPELAQGIFATPGSYEAILRISSIAGDILDDAIALPHGMALKVIGVEGERLPGAGDSATQDFVMVNGPVFSAPDADGFLKNLKLLAATTDVADGAKKAFSAVLQGLNAALTAIGHPSPTLTALGGAAQTNPLGETFYSQTPYRYGDHIAKLSIAPVSPALTSLTGVKVELAGRPDGIREDVSRALIEQGGTWELRVQLNTDLDAMPIEDPTVRWDEEKSPFIAVATLEVAPQIGWEHHRSDRFDDALSFSPWHGIEAHRPLGNVNRARRDTYKASATFRGGINGCPMHEPTSARELEPAA